MNKNSSDLDQLRRLGWLLTAAAVVFVIVAGYVSTLTMELSWLLAIGCAASALCYGIAGIWALILVGQMEASEDQRVRGSNSLRPSRYPSDR